MMTRTGFVNVASRYGLKSWGNVSLEPIIADPPQVLLAGEIAPGMPTWADRVLRHPALAAVGSRMKRATFPDTLMYCGGPVLIQSAAALAAARAGAPGVAP
jgi:iron complex transport system substrate-binding protein